MWEMKNSVRGIEPIFYQNKEVACVYRSSIAVSDIQFLTSADNPFQIGIHDRQKPVKLPAHIHNCPKPLVIDHIQEILYVISGKIRVTIVSETNRQIAKKLLSPGDAILLKTQAHSVEFLGNARVFEIKQGPYPGNQHAKRYLT